MQQWLPPKTTLHAWLCSSQHLMSMWKQPALLLAPALGLFGLLTACSEPKVQNSHQPSEPDSLGTFGWMAEFDSGGCMVSLEKQAAVDLDEQSLMDVRNSSCSVVRIAARSVRLGETVAACPDVKALSLYCDEIKVERDLATVFPNLVSLWIKTNTPSKVHLGNIRNGVNTLHLEGPWSSLAGLDSSTVQVVQLIMQSDSLKDIDSLHIDHLQTGILNLQGTPVAEKMHALCPTPGECNHLFGAHDSLVLVY